MSPDNRREIIMLKPSLWIFPLLLASAGTASADGDDAHGRVLFGRCVACHSIDAGKNLSGPSLHDIVGRKAGTVAGYRYSKAMAAAGLTWDRTTLDRFLAAPTKMVPGTKMRASVPNEMDRADIIAYLSAVP
jgi:cytochrome c2